MAAPVLKDIVPKTITSIGKFNGTLNLSRIFDVVPLSETEDFKLMRIKYEGLLRDVELGGVPVESGTEFKNSVTMDIQDRKCEKVRAVKIHCEGIHMCGNRSVERSSRIAEFVVNLISDTHAFISRCNGSWETLLRDPHYPHMENTILSILPEMKTPESIGLLMDFLKDISLSGGLYQLKPPSQPKDSLRIEQLRTVMVNYGYGPYRQMQDKELDKETFLRNLTQRVLFDNVLAGSEFDIRLDYDSHISSLGWSGSVPFKFTHRKTGQVQWITLQLRRGTIVHSGPDVEVMQKAIDTLFRILF